MKQTTYSLLGILSLFLLIYLLIPGPNSIQDFPALPNSVKSTLDGDTVQVPNVSAYFSNNYRKGVTAFYNQFYQRRSLMFFPPIRLNYPPEYAFVAIKKHTDSTFLEELVYPLRNSLYINGFEPFEQSGGPRYTGAAKFVINGKTYETKMTLRYYPIPWYLRITVWVGINISFLVLIKVGKRVWVNG